MIHARPSLIEAARDGNAQAISQLLSECQPDLKRFARRTCNNTEDAEEAVQVALWQLYRKIGALRTVATFATWLFRIVERECYRLFRAQPVTESLDDVRAQALIAPTVPLDLRIDIGKAIAALPASYREVLLLRDVEELSAPEVAAHLGLSLEAVKSRLHRARAKVREGLIASGYWLKDTVADETASQKDDHVL